MSRGGPGRTAAARRRQRSVRVTVAVALMTVGTVAVLTAVATGSRTTLAVVSVASVACGWASARITYAELLESRRRHARDRAVQARAFHALLTSRADEHAAFATALTRRLAARDRELAGLEASLRLSERRAGAAQERARREARRADEAEQRVSDLEVALEIRTAEEADELATWESSGPDADTVVDLLSWEERSRSARGSLDERRRA